MTGGSVEKGWGSVIVSGGVKRGGVVVDLRADD